MKKNLQINKILLIAFILLLTVVKLFAQTDKTFWFVAPEVTFYHHNPGGKPIFISVSTSDLPANVTISEPANATNFPPISFYIPANSTHKVDLTSRIGEVENRYDNLDGELGKSNKGILIESDVNVTAYYEESNRNNPDIFALKGKNALGTDFFVPFQIDHYNHYFADSSAYSSIDVVFTEDNTFLDITPARNSTFGAPNHPVGFTYTVGPFDKGETYSITPAQTNPPVQGAAYQGDEFFGRSALDHISGTRVKTHGKKIAITVHDDSMKNPAAGCYDLGGDQIIPTDIIGKEYIAMKGGLTTNGERVYIVAIQDNTDISFDGGAVVATIQTGETYTKQLTNNILFVKASKPVYALQVTGFGCEMGEAILPPIDVCTGSTQVGFTRSTSEGFFLNLMVRVSSKDAKSKFYIDGVLQDGTASPGVLFGPGDFQAVPGTSDWLVYRTGNLPTGDIPVNVQTLIKNTGDVFHLGIINGGGGTGTRFGYFSDFNKLAVNAFVSGSQSENIRLCYGESAQLSAGGGTNIVWSPADYLDDPLSAIPVSTPPSTINYVVTVSGACDMIDSASVTVEVSSPLEANFTIDTTQGCSPLNVSIHDKSLGVHEYHWDFGDGSPISNYTVTQDTIEADTTIYHTFSNNSDTAQTFTIELLVKNTNDCTDTLRRSVIVYPYAEADFDLDNMGDTIGCHPVQLDFNNNSLHGKYYLWEFGDGGSSSDSVPSHTFNNIGLADSVYTVSLVTTTEYFCRDTAYQDIYVHPYIKADFDFDPSISCNPYDVAITNNSVGAGLSYDWDFGDGSAISHTSAASFNHLYNNLTGITQDYELKLVVSGLGGCSDSLTRIVTVYPEITAGFTVVPDNGCSALDVAFTSTSQGVAIYEWDFGDGSSSSSQDTTHTFLNLSNTNDTSYIVTLTTYSSLGCSDVFQDTIYVYHNSYAQFTVDSSSGCSPHDVYISNSSIGQDSCSWNFGDLQTADTCGTSFSHSYDNDSTAQKIYDITLITTTEHNCTDTLVQNATIFPNITSVFVADSIIGCNPLTVTFTNNSEGATNNIWDFGDGSTSNLAAPTHTFLNSSFTTDSVYTVRLTTTNSYGCTAQSDTNITVYPKPNANFTVDNSPGCSPYDISITNSSEGDNITYLWDFGDGSPTSNISVASFTHHYDNDSTAQKIYDITLVTTSTHNCKDTLVQGATIFPNISSEFSVNTEGCNPLTVTFDNTSTGVTGYVWNFGDGSTSNEATPTHTYLNSSFEDDSIYTVRLTTTNDYGCMADSSIDITVHAKPKADFIVDNSSGCSPYTVNMENNSIGADSCYWDFGDGITLDTIFTKTMSHKYTNDGNEQIIFNIQLKVFSNHGCSDTISQTATIYPNITSKFDVDIAGCNPHKVVFENNSGGATSYSWDFGDGSFSTSEHPEHVFYNTSNYDDKQYTVTLTTHNDYGCVAMYDTIITVYAKPKAEFIVNNTPGCSPFEINIRNNSFGADSCYWQFGDDSVSYSKENTVRHLYNNDSDDQIIYPIQLITYTNNGCSDTITRNATIYPNISAKFSSIISGCHPLTVDFTSQSQGETGYSWNFGDGTSSGEKNPSHTFYNYSNTDSAVSKVTLTTINDFNCSAVYDTNITIYPVPDAIFTLDSSTACSPFDVVIHNASPGASHYLWDFGDNITLDTNQTDTLHHIYHNYTQAPVSHTIKLHVNNEHGCEDTTSQPIFVYPEVVPNFDADNYSGCHPLTVQFTNNSNSVATIFNWNFDDGVASDLKNPKHILLNNTQDDKNYSIELTGYSDYGCKASITREITVYPTPLADFEIHDPNQTFPDATVDFIDKTQEGQWYYDWNFGDGYSSSEQNPSHEYSTWGVATVTLIVGNLHCFDTIKGIVTITAPNPIAQFAEPESGCPPVTVYFTCDTTYITSYKWNFGNGVYSYRRFPKYTYYDSGDYRIGLTVEGDGGKDSTFQNLTVYRLPQAMFSVSPSKVKLTNDPIHCQNMSSDNSIFWLWNFGDGSESNDFEPLYQYTSEGKYDISLYVETEEGCTDTLVIRNAVEVKDSCGLVFPNAFTPSKTGPSDGRYPANDLTNQIFYPRYTVGVVDYNLKIFNRWGELLFETNEIDVGWDGYYLGELCKQDVYVWKVVAKCSNGHDIINAGNVTLIR